MNLKICPICGATFVPNAMNQRYDKWSCKKRAEIHRRRTRDKPPEVSNGEEESGLFTTLTNPTLEQLRDLHTAYTVTRSHLPSRIIGDLPRGWDEAIHLDTIVPEFDTPNHMYMPQ